MDDTLHQSMAPKYERLQTFHSSPILNNLTVSNSPLKLAEAGFSRSPGAILDEVECISCGAKYSGWSGESPLAVHRILNPFCLFLNTPPANETGNLIQDEDGNHRNELEILRRQRFPLSKKPFSSIFSVPDIEQPFLPKRGGYRMLFEAHRLLTFKNPLSKDAALYAKGGFVYSVSTESVFCIYCDIELDFQSTNISLLETAHSEKFPQCPFVRLYDVGNISMDLERKIRGKVRVQHHSDALSNKINILKAEYIIKYPQYEDETVRVGTFKTWPKLQAVVFPAQIMAACGFYYTGFNDKVKCYACGVGLYDWSFDAVPAEQHAKASPKCVFLLQSKSKEFMDNAQKIELIVQADIEEVSQQSQGELDAASSTTDSDVSSSSSLLSSPALSSSRSSSLSSPGSTVLDLGALEAAMACGQYPNTDLLLGTLKAADENHITICQKTQELVLNKAKEAALQQEIQAKNHLIQAKDTELLAKERELQRNAFEMQWRDLEVRTELEQQFIGQLQQQNEMLQHKDQLIEQHKEVIVQKDQELEQKDQVIEQKDQALEHNAIQLEMKNKEVADLHRHIRSLKAELERRQGSCGSDDEESSSSSDVERTSESDSSSEEFPVASCKVCLVRPSQIVFLPCKHLCCCDGCASRLHGKNCPICRARNLGFEKVYVI